MDDKQLLDDQIRRTVIGLASRSQAMMIYGVMAVAMGLFMMTTGAPGAVEASYGPWVRIWLGIPCFVAGAMLCIGAPAHGRARPAWWSALAGSSMLCLWATAMAVLYTVAASHDGVVFVEPGQELSRLAARPYASALLEGFSVLVFLHVLTLIKLRPPRR